MNFRLKAKQKRLFLQNTGNLLMLSSLLFLLYIYYPLLVIYIDPPKLTPTPKTGEYITIPKIQAQAPIVDNVDPWNERVYKEKLQKGVAQAKGSSKIGSTKGTIYLFAHSSDLPWRLTRYNTAFFKLGQVKINDKIILTKNGRKYTYVVTDKKVVWPTDVKYLKELSKTQLVLQTCTPVGTDLQRLLVFAKPQTFMNDSGFSVSSSSC